MPLAGIDNEGIFSSKRDIIETHAIAISTELSPAPARIKVDADPK
jgi:hypothetical protein